MRRKINVSHLRHVGIHRKTSLFVLVLIIVFVATVVLLSNFQWRAHRERKYALKKQGPDFAGSSFIVAKRTKQTPIVVNQSKRHPASTTAFNRTGRVVTTRPTDGTAHSPHRNENSSNVFVPELAANLGRKDNNQSSPHIPLGNASRPPQSRKVKPIQRSPVLSSSPLPFEHERQRRRQKIMFSEHAMNRSAHRSEAVVNGNIGNVSKNASTAVPRAARVQGRVVPAQIKGPNKFATPVWREEFEVISGQADSGGSVGTKRVDRLADLCGNVSARSDSGAYSGNPVDSVVWLSFTVPKRTQILSWAAEVHLKNGSTRHNQSSSTNNQPNATTARDDTGGLAELQRDAKLTLLRAMGASQGNPESEYYTFFADYNATVEVEGENISSTCPIPTLQPFSFDVVYTYVNNSAPSHVRKVENVSSLSGDVSRFRDWNELQYSLRTVYHRGVCQPRTGERSSRKITCQEGNLIRNVYIVVADRDQVPAWLNLTAGGTGRVQIRIVTHDQIFPPEDVSYLPTFNSHAIESALHRIPGISRFFVYFNNDMFWGRRLSLFDYFRPLSHSRALRRVEDRVERLAKCNAASVGAVKDLLERVKLVVDPVTRRASFLMEPILYFEGIDQVHECRAAPKFRNGTNIPNTTTTEVPPYTLPAAYAGKLRTFPPNHMYRPRNVIVSPNMTSHGLSKHVATSPTSTPMPNNERSGRRLRNVTQRRLAALTAAAAATTAPETRISAFGEAADVPRQLHEENDACRSIPYEASALFQVECPVRRRQGPRMSPIRTKADQWRRFLLFNRGLQFHRINGANWVTHSFAHYPRLMDRTLMQRMEEVDFKEESQLTRRSRDRNEQSFWTTQMHQWFALGQRRAVDHRLVVSKTNWSRPKMGASVGIEHLHPPNDQEFNQLMTTESFPFVDPLNDTEVLNTFVRVASDAVPKEFQSIRVEPSSGTSMLEEKLNFHAVRLDRKFGAYYFCMMKTLQIQSRCLTETVGSKDLLGEVQLFVTVNDDFPRFSSLESVFQKAVNGAKLLFESLSGFAPPAPWEKVR